MHEPEERQQHDEATKDEQQGISVRAAYRVLVRAFYRLECIDNTEEDNHG